MLVLRPESLSGVANLIANSDEGAQSFSKVAMVQDVAMDHATRPPAATDFLP